MAFKYMSFSNVKFGERQVGSYAFTCRVPSLRSHQNKVLAPKLADPKKMIRSPQFGEGFSRSSDNKHVLCDMQDDVYTKQAIEEYDIDSVGCGCQKVVGNKI